MRLHGFDLWVIYVSTFATGMVVIVAVTVSVRTVTWKFGVAKRLSLITTAVFAACYHVSYWWLLFNPTEAADWSEVMRPVGMVAWFLGPWLALPLTTFYQAIKISHRMERDAREMVEEVRADDPQEVP